MHRKFAKIIYSQTQEEISLKYNVIKKSPETALDWYVKKYNPFKMQVLKLAGESGYTVKIPLTEEEAGQNIEKTSKVMLKTVEAIKDYHVEIVIAPKNTASLIRNKIRLADGIHTFPFFIMQASIKALKAIGKDIRDCEFLIINGNDALTEMIIDNIYEEVNFLTIIVSHMSEKLTDKAEDIFYETGLSIRFLSGSKAAVKTADIIINASCAGNRFDYAFKRNAIYFDVCGNKDSLCRLLSRRGDMIIADGLKLAYRQESLSLKEFELAIYLKSKEYRHILAKEYSTDIARNIQEIIKKMRVSIAGFYQSDKAISTASLFKAKSF